MQWLLFSFRFSNFRLPQPARPPVAAARIPIAPREASFLLHRGYALGAPVPNPLEPTPATADGAESDTTPLCDGRFVAFHRLGSGSQAETFEGVDRKNGCAVAIKRFDVHGATSWKDVELAEREARVLSTLKHPDLPAYVHHFEHAGALYLVMQKVDGEYLARRLECGKRFQFDELLRLLETLAAVFEYLHQGSPPIVHRDVKPSNIIQRPDGGFSLIDFGSVRDGLRPTGGSTVVGTFGFMAPEQFQGRALPASDLYGAGATLLTLMTGITPDRLPHRGLCIDVRSALPATTPPAWLELLELLVCTDPDQRSIDLRVWLPRLRPFAPQQAQPPATEPTVPASPQPTESESVFSAGTTLPFVFVVAFTLLRALLFVVLQIALPTILMMLSVIFGRGMRKAASNVTRAGHEADRQLARLTTRLIDSGPVVVRRRQRTGAPWRKPPRAGPFSSNRPPQWAAIPHERRRMRVGNFDVELPPDPPEHGAETNGRRRS